MIFRLKFLYCLELLCLFLVFAVVVLGKPPVRGPARETSSSGTVNRYSILKASTTMATKDMFTTSFYITDFTDSSTAKDSPSAANVTFGLAAGIGLALLLVILLLIALSLVLYQRHVERLEAAERERNQKESTPPPVPKRPDDETDDNFNGLPQSPRRGSSGVSYNYIRPEPVRIALAQQRVDMDPRMKARRREGGDEYYSVVQDSSPRFDHIDDQRRKSEQESNYYIQVVDNERDGAQRTPSSKENPYYMQVEEGSQEHVEYVIDAINGESQSQVQVQSPKRQDSDNDYYSRVHTLNKTEASNSNNDIHANDVYSVPPDMDIERQPERTTQESHKYSNVQAVRNKNKVPKSKVDSKDDGTKSSDANNKKKKSVIYMNLRKFKR